jgi:hypothetical protein
VNAGGRRYDGPFGTVYATNITPDAKTGIGGWTDAQIVEAIRSGRRPNGERLIPVHPYTTFNGMAEPDLKVLVAYLRTLPGVNRANQPKKIAVPLFESVFLPAWLAAFSPRDPPPTAPTSGLSRGVPLRAVAHCGECSHLRPDQAVDNSLLAGNLPRPEDSWSPASPRTRPPGIGDWSGGPLAEYLATGNRPDGDVSSGLMERSSTAPRPVTRT